MSMISRQKLIEDIEKEFDGVCTYDVSPSQAVSDFIEIVDKQPPADQCVLLSEVYRVIAGHSDYHGDNILAALTCIAEGKEVKPVRPLPADQWVPCSERLPDTEEEVMITLTHTYEDEYRQRSVARYLRFENGEAHWCDNRYGYIGWDKYSDGYAGTSNYKVTAWMPLPEAYKGE